MPNARENTGVAKPAGSAQLAELPEHLVQQFMSMATMVPNTESDGGAGILEGILNAIDVQGLDDAWDEKDQDKLVGQTMIVESISKSASDFADGLGVFLVVHAVLEETAEDITWTTGSVSVVAQLVRAYTLDAFPMRCKLRRAEKATANGYYPMNLVIDKSQPKR